MSLRLEVKLEVGDPKLVKFLLGVDWLNLRPDWLDDRPWPSSAKTAPALPLILPRGQHAFCNAFERPLSRYKSNYRCQLISRITTIREATHESLRRPGYILIRPRMALYEMAVDIMPRAAHN